MPAVGTTHHVKLGDQYLIVRPNSYQKSPAPTFGARISTGDPDYNNLSIWQHWVQHCWAGGMGAPEWVDDSMFKEGVGVNTTVHEKATLGRQFKRGTGTGWGLGSADGIVDHQFAIFNEKLFCLRSRNNGDSRLYRLNNTTQSWESVGMPGSNFWAKSIIVFDGSLIIGGVQRAPSPDKPKLYWSPTPNPSSPDWTSIDLPEGVTTTYGVTAMKVYNSKLYVAFGVSVWRMLDTFNRTDPPLSKIWDGTTRFYKANANGGSSVITVMENHLGFLYMLSSNGHLHRTDGNNTFDIWAWDGQTMGTGLRSYDGKLFVTTHEYTEDPTLGYGVLYQFTGAAVTELKRWGEDGRATTLGRMIVHARKMYYGAGDLFGVRPGFGVAIYDATEDAHSIYAVGDNVVDYADTSGVGRDHIVDDLIIFGGRLFVAVRGHGVFRTRDSYRDIERGEAEYTISVHGGLIESSLYDVGTPGLEKLWRRITVWADVPDSTSLQLWYSIDGGTTWTTFAIVAGPPDPANVGGRYDFYLNNIRSTRFQWKIRIRSIDEMVTPTLRSVSVAYLPQPEPNWSWSFVVPVADKWELIDGSDEIKDTNSLIAFFENLFRSQQLVHFTDIDGHEWASGDEPGVLVYDINIVHYDVEQPREADVRITLLETVEAYET